jgi:hypothetical protein
MKKEKTEFEEINLHGYKIHIYDTKVKIYNHNNIPNYEFKEISDGKLKYLMLEGFIPRKKIRVEIVTLDTPDETTT